MTPEYAVELEAPDISAYHGNTSAPFVTTLDSGKPGPDAMINAVIHGNEICGAIALDFLFKTGFKPTAGKLTLAFVNTAAYTNWDALKPATTRFVDEDMNRVWTAEQLESRTDNSVELARARELRPFYDRVQYLLDIHSMGTHHGALLLCSGALKQRQLCRQIGTPSFVGCGPGFVGQGKSRLIEHRPFEDDPAKVAVLVECGQHWAAETGKTAIFCVLNYLRALGMCDPAYFKEHAGYQPTQPQTFLEITDGYTAQSDGFKMVTKFAGLDRLSRKGTVIAEDGDAGPLVTPYDNCYLVMPPATGVAKKGSRTVRLSREVPLPALSKL
eukprot:SAG31_NODE_542_length_14269_cov_7.826253_5_plen_328_part_00